MSVGTHDAGDDRVRPARDPIFGSGLVDGILRSPRRIPSRVLLAAIGLIAADLACQVIAMVTSHAVSASTITTLVEVLLVAVVIARRPRRALA